MDIFLMYALFVLGIVLIVKCGDLFVDAASWIAGISGIPPFVVGATIVSLATTLPEIIVSVFAASRGMLSMAAGNGIGSVTSNTGLIMGISLIFLPSKIDRKKYTPKILLFVGSALILWLFSLSGSLGIIGSLAMFLLLAMFLFENIREARSELNANPPDKDPKAIKTAVIVKNIAMFVIGAAGIVIGSKLLVDNGSLIAASFGVDERIISITAVAIGTSLPELVTTVSAIAKKQASLSVGNIIGANIIDLSLILPLCAFVSGGSLAVEPGTVWVDLPVCLALIAITSIPTLIRGKFARWQGAVALTGYLCYIIYISVSG